MNCRETLERNNLFSRWADLSGSFGPWCYRTADSDSVTRHRRKLLYNLINLGFCTPMFLTPDHHGDSAVRACDLCSLCGSCGSQETWSNTCAKCVLQHPNMGFPCVSSARGIELGLIFSQPNRPCPLQVGAHGSFLSDASLAVAVFEVISMTWYTHAFPNRLLNHFQLSKSPRVQWDIQNHGNAIAERNKLLSDSPPYPQRASVQWQIHWAALHYLLLMGNCP